MLMSARDEKNESENVVSIGREKNKYWASEWLRERFYFVRIGGGQKMYYDAEAAENGLGKSHLIGHLCPKGFSPEEAKEIVEMTQFTPVLNRPMYRPGESMVISVMGNYYPNSWRNDGVRPNGGDANRFLEHQERMLGSTANTEYLVKQLAYRYQNNCISKKPHVAFYLYGKPGMGKSLLSQTIQKVFGPSATRKATDESALNSKSSVDLWKRTWLIVEEVDVRRGSANYNNIKTMTGSCQFDADRKNEHFRTHETPAQLIMLSNDAPSFLENGDRRFFVSKYETEFANAAEKDKYFNEYVEWLENGGYEAIAQLLKDTDISSVNLASPAPMTEEKELALSFTEDPAVQDIQNRVEEKGSQLVFVRNDFSEIGLNHKLNPRALIYKMADAGLVKWPPVKITVCSGVPRKNVTPWTREGDRVVVSPGKVAVLRTKDGMEVPLEKAMR